jgi:hypothetical protein
MIAREGTALAASRTIRMASRRTTFFMGISFFFDEELEKSLLDRRRPGNDRAATQGRPYILRTRGSSA